MPRHGSSQVASGSEQDTPDRLSHLTEETNLAQHGDRSARPNRKDEAIGTSEDDDILLATILHEIDELLHSTLEDAAQRILAQIMSLISSTTNEQNLLKFTKDKDNRSYVLQRLRLAVSALKNKKSNFRL